MVSIKIIVGSNRPGRFGIQPANWLHEVAKQYADKANIEIVDLAEINLPFLDETTPPSMSQDYEKEYTKAWAKIISDSDGFVFVTPEYNHSYSAVLKNAIDYLNPEWLHKPVSFLSYGGTAGGARSVEHLRGVVSQLGMYDLTEHMLLPEYYMNLDDQGQYKFSERHEKNAKLMLEALIFWAEKMKDARADLAA